MPRGKRLQVHADAINLVAETCKKARLYYGKSLEDVSKKTLYSVSALKQFERGNSNNMLMFIKYHNLFRYYDWSVIIK